MAKMRARSASAAGNGPRGAIHVLRFMSCRWFRGLPAADERGIPGAAFSRSRPRNATPPTAARCAKCLTAPAPNAAPSLPGRPRSWSCRAMANPLLAATYPRYNVDC